MEKLTEKSIEIATEVLKRMLKEPELAEQASAMGERIALSSDAALMREAAAKIERLATELSDLKATLDDRTSQPQRYTCEGKGGDYILLGTSHGAGSLRSSHLAVYQDTTSGQLFHRTLDDFAERMRPIASETPSEN